jgi:CRISPR-associated protein Cas2
MATAYESAMLSGYRLMWMLVMFDLPVGTKKERKAASAFRNFLLDEGFEMNQFSVYMRFSSGKEHVETLTRHICDHVPASGHVDVLNFTDKQYENITSFKGKSKQESKKNPAQFVLL